MPLSVLFDYQSFSRQNVGGVSRSFVELARELAALDGVQARIFAPFHWNEYLRRPENRPFSTGIHQSRGVFALWNARQRFNRLVTSARCLLGAPDILHETWYPTIPAARRKRTRIATTVHDMIYQVHPEWTNDSAERSRQLAASVDRAHVIVCVSDYTRNDLLNWRPSLDPARVFVVHHGVSAIGGPSPGAGRPVNRHVAALQSRAAGFFLYVGHRTSKNKNFAVVAEAFAHSGLSKDFVLVLFGGGGITAAEEELFLRLGFREGQIIHLQGDDDLLRDCYENAVALVYPSLHEGFGMPLLEAMHHGCPVISSNATSLPEVGGDAVLYFDPACAGGLSEGMQFLSRSPEIREKLRSGGRAHSARFSWAHSAQKLLAAYRAVPPDS